MKRIKPNPNDAGERIREIRNKLGLSMEEFASRIDDKAKSGTVSNWETGKNLPNNQRLNKIAEMGGVTLDYLLYGGPINYLTYNFEKLFPEDKPYLISIVDGNDLINFAKKIEEANISFSNYRAVKNIIEEKIPLIESKFLNTIDEYLEIAYNSKDQMEEVLSYSRNVFDQPQYKDKTTFLRFLNELENSSINYKADYQHVLEGYINGLSSLEEGGFYSLVDDYAYEVEFEKLLNLLESHTINFDYLEKKHIVYRSSIILPVFDSSFLIPSDENNTKIYMIPYYDKQVDLNLFINRKCYVIVNGKNHVGMLESEHTLIIEETNKELNIDNHKFISPILLEIY